MLSKSKVIWWVDQQWLYVRFENIERSSFLYYVELFKFHVGSSVKWHHDFKAWRLSKLKMEVVALFAHENFGSTSLQPLYSDMPIQLELPLSYGADIEEREINGKLQ